MNPRGRRNVLPALAPALLWLVIMPCTALPAAPTGDNSCLLVGDVAAARLQEEVMSRVPPGYGGTADYERAVDSLMSQHGPLHADLFPVLLGLGLAYREGGRHEDADSALYHALFVVRANEGLYSLTQLPILDLIIDSRAATGDWRGVADAYDLMDWVYRRNYEPDDPRVLPALKRLRRWNFEAYNKETGRTLDALFDNAARYYRQGLEIVEQCTGDRQAALCFWHKGCCKDAPEDAGRCPAEQALGR